MTHFFLLLAYCPFLSVLVIVLLSAHVEVYNVSHLRDYSPSSENVLTLIHKLLLLVYCAVSIVTHVACHLSRQVTRNM